MNLFPNPDGSFTLAGSNLDDAADQIRCQVVAAISGITLREGDGISLQYVLTCDREGQLTFDEPAVVNVTDNPGRVP